MAIPLLGCVLLAEKKSNLFFDHFFENTLPRYYSFNSETAPVEEKPEEVCEKMETSDVETEPPTAAPVAVVSETKLADFPFESVDAEVIFKCDDDEESNGKFRDKKFQKKFSKKFLIKFDH